jgi:AcrR family transcriptional regulator
MAKGKRQSAGRAQERNREATRQALIQAVGELLADKGFTHLGVNALARRAGVDKVLIYRYFGGLPGLIKAFGQESDFWPSIEELADGDIEYFKGLSLEQKLVSLGSNFLKGIRKRPLTQEIMIWEMAQHNEFTKELEAIREKRMLQFAQMFIKAERVEETTVDLMAIMAIIGAGLSYLVCRTRKGMHCYNSLQLDTDEGWQRVEMAIRQIVKSVLGQYAGLQVK